MYKYISNKIYSKINYLFSGHYELFDFVVLLRIAMSIFTCNSLLFLHFILYILYSVKANNVNVIMLFLYMII